MIIAVINNKGGTGKTTTCVNLAAALSASGYRVLLVDLDSQASASLSLGVNYNDLYPSVSEVLFDGDPIRSAIRSPGPQMPDILPGSIQLANSDLILSGVTGREYKLRKCLEGVSDQYDFIICDCPPSLSLLSVNALVASDAYLVPVTLEYLALEGLVSLMAAAEQIQRNMEVHPVLLGIVFTLYTPGLKISREIEALVRAQYPEGVFQTRIRRNVKLGEAPAYGTSIFEHDSGSTGARDYRMLTEEVLRRCGVESIPHD